MRLAHSLLAGLALSLLAAPGLAQRGGKSPGGVTDDYTAGSPDGFTIGIGVSAGTQRPTVATDATTAAVLSGRYDVPNPDWVQFPVIAGHYPQQAFDKKVSGVVLLHCVIRSDGSLTRCLTTDEKPAGVGFAKAAMDMAPLFQMRGSDIDGRPVSGRTVAITLWFDLPAS